LGRLRRIVHNNLIAFEPDNEKQIDRPERGPRQRDATDVALALAACKVDPDQDLPFEIVDRTYLSIQAEKPRRPFVARPPEWADVIHGFDSKVKFLERDATTSLRDAIVDQLIGPVERGTDRRLHMLFVTGAPGSGKTTLARRVAAMFVEEGRAVVADAGIDIHDPVDDAAAYVSELRALAAAGRPILFLVDDPLYAGSPWIDLLHRLAKPGLGVAVLAACPDFLYKQFSFGIHFGVRNTFELGGATESERGALADIYGRERQELQATEEFLVLSMQASAGIPFDEIIRRLWWTLNKGQTIAEDKEYPFPELNWTVRAFLFVCFFHRAYVSCPEPLLRAALEETTGAGEIADPSLGLARLQAEDGWTVFRILQPERKNWAYAGAQVASAHQLIAVRAWDLRPVPYLDLGTIIIAASLRTPQTLRVVGQLAARLATEGDQRDLAFVKEFVENWNERGQHPDIDTRYLCDLTSALQINGQRQFAIILAPALARRAVPSPDGWLAALQLNYLTGETAAEQTFPEHIDLSALIRSANFSLAPIRATVFLAKLPQDLTKEFNLRLLDAFDHKLDWTLDSFLMTWLLSHATWHVIAPRLAAINQWLDDHPNDSSVRVVYLSLLGRTRGKHSPGMSPLLIKAAHDMRNWLEVHPNDKTARTQFYSFLGNPAAGLDDLRLQAADDLEKHISAGGVPETLQREYESFLPRLRGEMPESVFDEAEPYY
jgi:hypothetical protein